MAAVDNVSGKTHDPGRMRKYGPLHPTRELDRAESAASTARPLPHPAAAPIPTRHQPLPVRFHRPLLTMSEAETRHPAIAHMQHAHDGAMDARCISDLRGRSDGLHSKP